MDVYRKEEGSYGGQRSIDLQMIRDYEQTGCRLKEFLENCKKRDVKLEFRNIRPPKRTFPRSKKKSRSARPQPNSLKNKRRSRRQGRPDRPQTVFRSR